MALEERQSRADAGTSGHDDDATKDETNTHDTDGGSATRVEVLGRVVDQLGSPVAVLGDQDRVAMLAVRVGD